MFGANGLVSRSTPSGTTWYAFDERGNVAQRTGSGGGVVSSDLYDAFGNVTRTGGPDVFGFGGQAGYYTDTETGLILCTNRHYDPQQGRFLTRDPIGYDGGINLYSYTRNNPINWMDPDGTDALDNAIMAVAITTGGLEGGMQGGALGGGLGTLVEPGGGTLVGGAAGVYAGAAAGAGIGAGIGGLVVGLRHAVMNMSGGGGGIETGPESSGGPYSHLQDPPNVGPRKEFEPEQKEAIYQENMRRNGGVLRDDETGEELQRVGAYKRGEKVPANAAQIDHIIPRNPADPTIAPGTNSYSNARVISRVSNRAKSNSCPNK
jgi:RHS repeat-associated protein